jgi:hypothetical protein
MFFCNITRPTYIASFSNCTKELRIRNKVTERGTENFKKILYLFLDIYISDIYYQIFRENIANVLKDHATGS